MSAKENNWKLVLPLLVAVWALVGLQRMAPLHMQNILLKEFDLSFQELGAAFGVLALTWALGSLVAGFLTDKFGTRPMILIAGIVSAIFGWLSGAVATFGQLIGMRAVLGLGEGSLWAPLTMSATRMAPSNMRARVFSFFFAAFVLVSMVLGVGLVTQVALNYNWRWGFYFVAIPLALVILVLARVLKEPKIEGVGEQDGHKVPIGKAIKTVIKSKNVYVCALISILSIARLFLILSFCLIYLSKTHGLEEGSEWVLSFPLIGELLGAMFFGMRSDKAGKRKVFVTICTIVSAIALVVFALMPAGSSIPVLLAILFVSFFFAGGISPLVIGVIPSESVKPVFAASAIGLTNFIGELIGGGIFPVIGGGLGDAYGLGTTMMLAGILMGVAFFLSLLLKETGKVAAESAT